jgi:hypothetical protein
MQERLSVQRIGPETSHPRSSSIAQAVEQALALDSLVPESVLTLPGMSARKYRRMVNNLIRNLSNARYLEIGSWVGSTACAAMYGNTVTATSIGSEFGGPMDLSSEYCKNRSETVDFRFIESDFRGRDYSPLGKYNRYLVSV